MEFHTLVIVKLLPQDHHKGHIQSVNISMTTDTGCQSTIIPLKLLPRTKGAQPSSFSACDTLSNKRRLIIIIRLGLNVALTHKNRSYRDSETKGNVEA